ncbi:MAG: DUF4365 domain-containing protein [Rhodothermales bacterium]
MPKRPRSHQIETESQRHFDNRIPLEWVVRPVELDYGIDREVEIFDNEETTGLKFYVQLKATDESSLNKALKLRFDHAYGDYYHALDLPVLIVRYHSASKSMYWRWFHSFDSGFDKIAKRSFSFKIPQKNLFNTETSEELKTSVQIYRDLKSPVIETPLEFEVVLSGDSELFDDEYEIQKRLLAASTLSSSGLKISFSDKKPFKVIFESNHVSVRLGDFPGATFHYESRGTGALTSSTIEHDVFVAIGLAFDAHGHFREAASIVKPYVLTSELGAKPVFALQIAFLFARANMLTSALEVADSLMSSEDGVEAVQLYLLPFFAVRKSVSALEQSLGIQLVESIIQTFYSRNDGSNAAILSYNLGNYLRSSGSLKASLKFYLDARRFGPEYAERPYFWKELGGVLFGLEKFQLAEKCYKCSLGLESSRFVEFLHADALLFAGHFDDSARQFNNLLQEGCDTTEAEWSLKHVFAQHIINTVGMRKQKRNRHQYDENFDPSELKSSEIRELSLLILQQDALDSLAWFNLGGTFNEDGNYAEAFLCYLAASMIRPNDVDAWENAFVLSLREENKQYFELVILTAYQFNGAEFLVRISDQASEKRPELLSFLMSVLEPVSRDKGEFVLRKHNDDHSWDQSFLLPD